MKLRQLKTRLELPTLLGELALSGIGVEVGVQQGEYAEHILQHWQIPCPKCAGEGACEACGGARLLHGKLFCVDPWRACGEIADSLFDLGEAVDHYEFNERLTAEQAASAEHKTRVANMRALIQRIPIATEYVDLANASQDLHDAKYLHTVRKLLPYSAQALCHIWRMTSAEAASCFAHLSLDFVYIDARHDYKSVIEDLMLWTPLVKPGGIISGHDYLDGEVLFDRVEGPDGTVRKIDPPVKTTFGVKRAIDEIAKHMDWDVNVTTDDVFPTWYVRTAR